LKEASQPMQAGLRAYISQEDWRNATVNAGHLSQLWLVIGDLPKALDYAKHCVEIADKGEDSYWRPRQRAALANALHQAGYVSEAEDTFYEAEELQRKFQPEFPQLHSHWGFFYCDLLLDQKQYKEVQVRATQSLEWIMPENFVLMIALDHLSLGWSYILQEQQEGISDFTQAIVHLRQSIGHLQDAGRSDHLPRGLLALAALRRLTGDHPRAQSDLAKAQRIAERGEMGLHLCDCHLEWARLHLAQGNPTLAREHWATAKAMVERMGYHRRDREVEEIARELGETA
jgi:tetratricopeptide (TPR) repeat protein